MAFEGSDLADKRTLSGLVRTMSGRLDRLMEESSRGGAGAASTEEARNSSVTEDVSLHGSLSSCVEFRNFFTNNSTSSLFLWGEVYVGIAEATLYSHTAPTLCRALCGDRTSVNKFVWH